MTLSSRNAYCLLTRRPSSVFRRLFATEGKDSHFYVSANVRLRTAQRVYPLNGIKVALLNRPSIGEFTARVLQDYGAEVTKYCEPFGGIEVEEEYGRRIDLSNGEDVNLIKNVARKVDILVDYLHGSRLEQVGLDPKEMLRTNSKLIVARITGFGQTGPLGGRTGGDTTYASLSGVMSQAQSGDEDTLRVCLKEAKALSMAGRSNAVTGVILALYDREHTGKGQIIDVSVTESIAYVKRVASESQLNIPPAFHR
ncbi:CoA-transferase family III [Aphelenchoides avenae]|nr:CoA-transferase family III [Aphelenchus avenae]